MKLIDILYFSLKAIKTRRLRNFLTLLGILIGVTLLTATLALAEGFLIQFKGIITK